MTPGFILDPVLMTRQAMSFVLIADLLAKGGSVGVMPTHFRDAAYDLLGLVANNYCSIPLTSTAKRTNVQYSKARLGELVPCCRFCPELGAHTKGFNVCRKIAIYGH